MTKRYIHETIISIAFFVLYIEDIPLSLIHLIKCKIFNLLIASWWTQNASKHKIVYLREFKIIKFCLNPNSNSTMSLRPFILFWDSHTLPPLLPYINRYRKNVIMRIADLNIPKQDYHMTHAFILNKDNVSFAFLCAAWVILKIQVGTIEKK